MKNLVFVAVLGMAALLFSCNSGGKYVIEGADESLVDGHWMFLMEGTGEYGALDSARIEGSAFRIETDNPGCGLGLLYMGTSSTANDLWQMSDVIFIEPGTVTAVYDADYEMFIAQGTPLNDLFIRLASGDMGEYEDKADIVRGNLNLLGLTVMETMMIDSSKPEMEALMALFPESLKEHPLYLEIKETLDAAKADVGMPYWDIEGVDVQGNAIRLSDVVERDGVRYVLLDMWASWCLPCREEIPHLVSQYARFKERGFEIYGMSFDANRESWRNAVENFGMSWTNVVTECPDGPRSSTVWAEYGMIGVPWNYLIDASTGEIIAKNLHGDDLVAELESLFGMD